MTSLSIALPDAFALRLAEITQITGKSNTLFVQEAVLEKIAEWDDLQDAQTEYVRVQSGQSKTTSLQDMMRDYGMAH